MRPRGDVRDDGDGGCDGGARGGGGGVAPAGRDGDPPPEAGRSYSCPPTQSTVSSSHSAAPKLNKSRRDAYARERNVRRPRFARPVTSGGSRASGPLHERYFSRGRSKSDAGNDTERRPSCGTYRKTVTNVIPTT